MGLNDDLPDHLRDHLPDGAAGHLYAQHRSQRRCDIRHINLPMGLSGSNAPSHEYQRDMRVIRIPGSVGSTGGPACKMMRLQDHLDVSSPFTITALKETLLNNRGQIRGTRNV